VNDPDWIVFRHHESIPERWRKQHLEGAWADRSRYTRVVVIPAWDAVAEPTGRFEVDDAGRVAEVWEIRLTRRAVERLRQRDRERGA
jgi:hypothetical protein